MIYAASYPLTLQSKRCSCLPEIQSAFTIITAQMCRHTEAYPAYADSTSERDGSCVGVKKQEMKKSLKNGTVDFIHIFLLLCLLARRQIQKKGAGREISSEEF